MRWRPQFKIRTLMVVVLAVALVLWYLVPARRQDAAVARLEALHATIFYEGEASRSSGVAADAAAATPPEPGWLQWLTGLRSTAAIVRVTLPSGQLSDADQAMLAQLPNLRELHAEDAGINDEGCRYISGLSQLEVLDLSRSPVTDAGLERFDKLKKLRKLKLNKTQVRGQGLLHLRDLPALHTVELEWCELETIEGLSGSKSLSVLKAEFTPIKRLVLNDCPSLQLLATDDHSAEVIDLRNLPFSQRAVSYRAATAVHLENLPNVTSVCGLHHACLNRAELRELPGITELTFLSSSGVVQVLTEARNLPSLRKVLLDHTGMPPGQIENVWKLTSLEQVVIKEAAVSDEHLTGIGNLANLKRLELIDTKVSGAALVEVARLPLLETLILENSEVTDAGVGHLAEHPALKEIDLSGTNISGTCAASLGKCPALETIKVNYTGFADDGLTELASLRSLKRLEMWTTWVTLEGIAAFRKARPEVEVFAWAPSRR